MRSYKTSTPRATLAAVAFAMAAITVGVVVVAPAQVNSSSQQARTQAVAAALASAAVVADPPCVDVDIPADPKLESAHVRNGHMKRKQRG